MEHAWPLREFPLCHTAPHSRPAPLRFSPVRRLRRFVKRWQTGKAEQEYQSPPSLYVQRVDDFRVGTVIPASIFPSRRRLPEQTAAFPAFPPDCCSCLDTGAEKVPTALNGRWKFCEYFVFCYILVFLTWFWNSKGSCSYDSISPLFKNHKVVYFVR